MKKSLIINLLMISIFSCDPVSDMEANIENLTSQDIIVEFISFDESFNKVLEIPTNDIKLFQEVFDVGSTFLEPSLAEFDSVVIKNQAENILKIYKPNDTGRTIYNIEEDWLASEPSKRSFKYEFEITKEDIE